MNYAGRITHVTTTTGTQVFSERTELMSYILRAGSGADATMTIYNGTSVSDPVVGIASAKAGEAGHPCDIDFICSKIFVVVTGAGADALIYTR